tara:strand:- start:313 stop:1287 length:975 start_codon:yes stop_codon:yes gene_type:complete
MYPLCLSERLLWLVAGITLVVPVLSLGADYSADIIRILEEKCYRCHGDNKIKGGLRLDSPRSIMSGGDGGAVLVPGKPIDSLLYLMTTYPEDDPDYMPQKGEGLSQAEQDLLKDWIEGGAIFGGGFKHEAKPTIGKKYSDNGLKGTYKIVGDAVHVVSKLQAMGVLVDTVNHDAKRFELVYTYTELPGGSFDFGDAAELGEALVKLSLSRTNVADEDLGRLKKLQSIEYLDLSRTSIGDQGMAHIVEMPNLSYLNLRDTNVSDNSIEYLSRMENLKQIYLWSSGITESGAKALRDRLPEAFVVFDTDIGLETQSRRARNSQTGS